MIAVLNICYVHVLIDIDLHVIIFVLFLIVILFLFLPQKELKVRIALEDFAVILVTWHVCYSVDHFEQTWVLVFELNLVFYQVFSFYLLQFHVVKWEEQLNLIILINEIKLLNSDKLVVLIIALKFCAFDIDLHPLFHFLEIVVVFIEVIRWETLYFACFPIVCDEVTYLLFFHYQEVHDVWFMFVVFDMEYLLYFLFIVVFISSAILLSKIITQKSFFAAFFEQLFDRKDIELLFNIIIFCVIALYQDVLL